MINISRFIKIREGNPLVRFSATLFIISVAILLLFLLFPGDNSSSDLVSKDLGQNGDPIQFKSNFTNINVDKPLNNPDNSTEPPEV